jgi:lauroyl/myristoyl acyltransferase
VHGATAAKVIDRLDQLKRLVPVGYLPTLVERRVARIWENEEYRHSQEAQMRYLLEHTERAAEIPALARGSAEYALLRTYLRWHPKHVLRQPVDGVEWLTTRRDRSRSIIVSFIHHGLYEGLFASLGRAGAPCAILVSPLVLGPDTPTGLKQHIRLLGYGNRVIPATGGTDALQAELKPGLAIGIASDVPGHTEVTFLGRRVLASFGAALMAHRTNSQVVVATSRRVGAGTRIQVHEPLEPEDFDQPMDLLKAMLDRHAAAVLAWPEALDTPLARWGVVEEWAGP